MRFYRVTCYLPPHEGKTYGTNILLGIAEVSVEAAIAAAKSIHKTARIDGVNDQGRIHNLPPREPNPGDLVALTEKPE